MRYLVTGGLGFIGSHTVVELINNDHEVVIADNLINSKLEVLDKIYEITGVKPNFFQIDVTDEEKVRDIFLNHKLDGVIHFAGLKAVGESISKPLEYYYNNLVSTMVLSKLCLEYKVNKFVFSSSATVYGEQESPLNEGMELKRTTNPYGETKAMSDRILMDTANANEGFRVCLLRYFNPVGAHESGLIGENPNGIPNNLMPYISQVAVGKLKELSVFGSDYETKDGTGVRDYIHVVDLAKGHIKALEKLEKEKKGIYIYNLGTGKGYSVLDMINAFEKSTGKKGKYKITQRRPGDIATCYSDTKKAKEELGWEAKKGIKEMCEDSWNFIQKNK